MKPSPYCTAQMLADLNKIATAPAGRCPGYDKQRWWNLKSRGWMNYQGVITAQGLAYLAKRGYITASTN